MVPPHHEQEELPRYLSPDEKKGVLQRRRKSMGWSRFIVRAYVNVTRFSIEGTD